jgi:hypothetical protein
MNMKTKREGADMQAGRKTQSHQHRRRFGRAQDVPVAERSAGSKKPHDSLCCKVCGVVYGGGRWHWGPKPVKARPCECPACQRIRNRVPAGVVRLSGGSVALHAKEMRQLALHQEEVEKAEHALNRIMAIEDTPQGLTISTTDIHLPRRIGQAIRRAFRGVLRIKFEESGEFVTVDWTSPENKPETA